VEERNQSAAVTIEEFAAMPSPSRSTTHGENEGFDLETVAIEIGETPELIAQWIQNGDVKLESGDGPLEQHRFSETDIKSLLAYKKIDFASLENVELGDWSRILDGRTEKEKAELVEKAMACETAYPRRG